MLDKGIKGVRIGGDQIRGSNYLDSLDMNISRKGVLNINMECRLRLAHLRHDGPVAKKKLKIKTRKRSSDTAKFNVGLK